MIISQIVLFLGLPISLSITSLGLKRRATWRRSGKTTGAFCAYLLDGKRAAGAEQWNYPLASSRGFSSGKRLGLRKKAKR